MTATLPAPLRAAAARLLVHCRQQRLTLTVAESCTGGLVSAAVTAIPGSSDVFERAFITYGNAAKVEMLGVAAALIDRHGAVSEPVARAMAEGALAHAQAAISIAITGIAGPGGGSPEKPVGTVHIASAKAGGITLHRPLRLSGDRDAVRLAAAIAALDLATEHLDPPPTAPRTRPRG